MIVYFALRELCSVLSLQFSLPKPYAPLRTCLKTRPLHSILMQYSFNLGAGGRPDHHVVDISEALFWR